MAPEFYDNLPCHYSWVRVIWDFVMDPAIGPYARVKRKRVYANDEEEDYSTTSTPASTSASTSNGNSLCSNGVTSCVNGAHANGKKRD